MKEVGFFVRFGGLPNQESRRCQYCGELLRVKPGLSWNIERLEDCINPKCPINQSKKNQGEGN